MVSWWLSLGVRPCRRRHSEVQDESLWKLAGNLRGLDLEVLDLVWVRKPCEFFFAEMTLASSFLSIMKERSRIFLFPLMPGQ
jgi:hypothetical protein